MHVRAGLENLLPLILCPDHESIHWSFDMWVSIPLSLWLTNDLGSVTLGVIILLWFWTGRELGQGCWGDVLMKTWKSWRLVMMRIARNGESSSCWLHEVKIRKLREVTSWQVLEESRMTQTRIESEWRMEQRSGRGRHWRGWNQIRKLGFVEQVDWAVSSWRVFGEVIIGLWCTGGWWTDQNGVKILFGLGQV